MISTKVNLLLICRKEILKSAVETIKMVHPYEKPVINAVLLLDIDDM
jgi:hypothetical protein